MVGCEVLNDVPVPPFAPENPSTHTFCQMNKTMVLRLKCASESPGGLVKQISRSTPEFLIQLVGGRALRICIFNKFPGDLVRGWLDLRPHFENHKNTVNY